MHLNELLWYSPNFQFCVKSDMIEIEFQPSEHNDCLKRCIPMDSVCSEGNLISDLW